MLMMMDWRYLVFMAPAFLLALFASIKTKWTFNKYSQRMATSQMTGAQAARRLLDRQGLQAVKIEAVGGFLSDHYDPTSRVLRLSPEVFGSPSLSALGWPVMRPDMPCNTPPPMVSWGCEQPWCR
jgi:Zn-dependent membrane protease YugP